jgi:hypothetical protein
LLTPKAKLLLVTLHYDAEGGPPFSVSEGEVVAAYAGAKVTKLSSVDARSEVPALGKSSATFVNEETYAIEFGSDEDS